MAQLEIIGAPQSPFVWACRIAAEEKGVAYSLAPAFPHTPEVQAIHPFGRIPVMRHGAVALAESKAIMTYIDRAFPGPALQPQEAAGAALVEQWVSLINTTMHPQGFRPYMMGYFFPGTADGSPNRALIEEGWPRLRDYLGLLDKAVSASGFLAGDSFSLADITLLPLLVYSRSMPESGEALTGHAALGAYLDRQLARPSLRATLPPPMPGR
jgi:glutathione S-transferase